MYRESEQPSSIFTIYVRFVFLWENMIFHAELNYFCKKGTNLSLFKGAMDYTFVEVDIPYFHKTVILRNRVVFSLEQV